MSLIQQLRPNFTNLAKGDVEQSKNRTTFDISNPDLTSKIEPF